MSPTAECKSITVKIVGSEKQGSDLLFMIFFFFSWCTRTDTEDLYRYEVGKNNNSKKWSYLPFFRLLMQKQPIQTGKQINKCWLHMERLTCILYPRGRESFTSWRMRKIENTKGLAPFAAKQRHLSWARTSLVWDSSSPDSVKERSQDLRNVS